VADATELSALADARRRVLAVGHLLLHHPAVRRARKLIADGLLGETLWLEAARLAPGPARTAGSVWWTLAPHDVSLALHLFDAVPTQVTAVGGAGAPGEELVVWATLHFDDGRLAHLHAARQAAEKRRGFSIVGTARALTFDELAAGGGALHLHDPTRVGNGTHTDPVPVDVIDALGAQCRHFVSSVARGDTGAGNGKHALAVVRVLDAGARSMRAGGAPIEVA